MNPQPNSGDSTVDTDAWRQQSGTSTKVELSQGDSNILTIKPAVEISPPQPIFVLAWVTKKDQPITKMGCGGSVLFVEHPVRGWEIPGGHLEQDESAESALLRELKEETGLQGQITAWNYDYYPKGWVAHVVVEGTSQNSWSVCDKNVQQVKWWSKTPPVVEWTIEEFEDLSAWAANL